MYCSKILLAMLAGLTINQTVFANTCLNGYELTAIVVMETDIRQSVEAYACRMAFPEDSSTYDLYNQLRVKWTQERDKQRKMRNEVYQRIYGDAWQGKVDNWKQTTAISLGKSFKATDSSCQELRKEMAAHAQDWQALYNASAHEAAQEKYDGLRCGTVGVIKVKTK